jgi:hypothetical protein
LARAVRPGPPVGNPWRATLAAGQSWQFANLWAARRLRDVQDPVVPLTGIEPMAYPLGEGRSILLSYRGAPACADFPNTNHSRARASNWRMPG